jgi:hypothetical protein
MHEASEAKENKECISCRGRWRVRIQIEVCFAAFTRNIHVDFHTSIEKLELVVHQGVKYYKYETSHVGQSSRIRLFAKEIGIRILTRVSRYIFGRQFRVARS